MTRSTKRSLSFAKNGATINVSSRLPADLTPSRLTQELTRIAPAIDLTLANPTIAGILYPEITLPFVSEYAPDAKGLASARAFLAEQLKTDPEKLVITASTSEAYAIAFKTFLAPGGIVAAPRPSYPLVPHLAELEGLGVIPYDLDRHDGFRIDVSSVREALEQGARIVVVISPNNPTGTVVAEAEMRAVAGLCDRYSAVMIVDRVFAEYPLEGSDVPVPRDLPGTVIELDGLSKRAGLPQAKVAWMHVHGLPEVVAALTWTNDAYLSASGPMQAALPTLWRTGTTVAHAIRRRVGDNLATLASTVASVPAITRLRAAAGWSAVLRLPSVVDDDTWVLELAANGVRVQPGYFYDFVSDGYMVVSLLPRPSVFAMGVQIITNTCGAMV